MFGSGLFRCCIFGCCCGFSVWSVIIWIRVWSACSWRDCCCGLLKWKLWWGLGVWLKLLDWGLEIRHWSLVLTNNATLRSKLANELFRAIHSIRWICASFSLKVRFCLLIAENICTYWVCSFVKIKFLESSKGLYNNILIRSMKWVFVNLPALWLYHWAYLLYAKLGMFAGYQRAWFKQYYKHFYPTKHNYATKVLRISRFHHTPVQSKTF